MLLEELAYRHQHCGNAGPATRDLVRDQEDVVARLLGWWLKAAQARPLQGWTAELDAIPQRASRVLEAAIQLTTPAAKMTTVRVATANLSSADEVERYIEALRTQLLDALNSGSDTVMVKG